MPETTARRALLERLLSAAASCEDVRELLDQVLGDAADTLGARGIAVVRANPPQWEIVARSGSVSPSAATEAAATALDEGRVVATGGWHAAPLCEGYALAVSGAQDLPWLASLGGSLAAAVATVHQRRSRAQRIVRMERMLQITQAWRQTDSMETLLQAMAEAAAELLDADRASIFLWDKAKGQVVGRPALGVENGELRLPDDTGIVGQVVQTGQPRRVGGGMDEDQIARQVDRTTGYTTRNLLCVPLTTPGGKRLGAFEVLNKRRGHFTDEDQLGLMEVAAHASVALESTQQFAELVSKHQRMVDQAAEGVQLVGRSPAIEALRSTVGRIANTDLAVLILGENGTGKEVAARSIHYLSRRREQPFVAVNCAALAESLLESELFGHEKGAFTDAHDARPGKFELAAGGTLLLDEIGDMSLSGQAKLLRVLEEKTVVRVGGSRPIHADVRVLAATNQDLAAMVRAKRFREDLYFRLNVVSLELPPLRERGDDILLLAEHFLAQFCRTMGRQSPKFSATARTRMLAHRWPGNVRELRNMAERIAYLSSGDVVEAADLALVDAGGGATSQEVGAGGTLADATRLFQVQHIQRTIDQARGNMSLAAHRLGLHRSNLYRKMRQLDMPAGEG